MDHELVEVLGRTSQGRLRLEPEHRVLVHTRVDGGRTPVFASAPQLRQLMQVLLAFSEDADGAGPATTPLERSAALLLAHLDAFPVHAVLGVAHLRRAATGESAVAAAFGGDHPAYGRSLAPAGS